LIGRAYKASENAYGGFVHKTRADIFDKYIEIAKKNDVELTDNELINIGRLVNALTGRGYLGKLEGAAETVNTIFFAPRNLKSHFDVLGGQILTGGASLSEIKNGENKGSNFVRIEAAKNLVKIVAGTALVLLIAKALRPDSVEEDPRSANFGKN
jgi:hypothetical protein